MHSRFSPVIAAICISCITCILADYEHTCYPELEHEYGRYVCGSSLAETVELICGPGNHNEKRDGPHIRANPWSRFRSTILGKRDTDRAIKDARTDWKENLRALEKSKRSNIAKLKKVTITKRQAADFRVSGQQHIVCECCYHMCSYLELTQYCLEPPF